MSAVEPPGAEGTRPDTSVRLDGVTLPANIEIRTLTGAAEMVHAVDVLQQVWGSPTELVRLEMLMAISHSGGYVSAVFDTSRDDDHKMLGASVGILARHRDQPALHSHVTGILPGAQHTGLGRSIKLHQRSWAAERGIDWIVWTFDPLVRRNAWFNIAVLGAEVHGYLESFYGVMTDAINAGDDSDRLLVAWHVATAGQGGIRDGDDVDGAELIPTPEDIVALRRTDPAEVARWRRETREALTSAIASGRTIVGFTRSGNYVVGPA